MRVVLTGASGLLGGEVLRQLLATGDEVVCLGRTKPGSAADFVDADLSAPLPRLQRLLPATADAIVHLAQSDKYNVFPEGAGEVFAVNVEATATLAGWARAAHASAFVHASTGGLYAPAATAICESDAILIKGPLSHYLASKRAAELVASRYEADFPVTALRYFFIYGAGQRSHMLMPRLIDSVRNGRALTLQGADGMRFNPVHVSDAAAATIAAVRAGAAGVFNVAGPEIVSLRGVGETIGGLMGRAPMFLEQPGAPNDLIADIGLMRAHLHTPIVRLREGLAEMCA